MPLGRTAAVGMGMRAFRRFDIMAISKLIGAHSRTRFASCRFCGSALELLVDYRPGLVGRHVHAAHPDGHVGILVNLGILARVGCIMNRHFIGGDAVLLGCPALDPRFHVALDIGHRFVHPGLHFRRFPDIGLPDGQRIGPLLQSRAVDLLLIP